MLTPQGKLTPQVLHNVAELVGWKLDHQDVVDWTPNELLMAYDYFMRVHLRASDNRIYHRPAPHFVRRAAHRVGD